MEQIEEGTGIPWTIEGVATYEHGNGMVRHFLFRCTSTINDGNGLIWSRKTGGALTKTKTITTGSIDLDFGSKPSASDAGVYVCRDSNSNDIAELNISDSKKMSLPYSGPESHRRTFAVDSYFDIAYSKFSTADSKFGLTHHR